MCGNGSTIIHDHSETAEKGYAVNNISHSRILLISDNSYITSIAITHTEYFKHNRSYCLSSDARKTDEQTSAEESVRTPKVS